MLTVPGLEPIDYLVIGHLTKDITPQGPQLGGTAAYAARTAQAMGLRVGMVTAWNQDVDSSLLDLEARRVVETRDGQWTIGDAGRTTSLSVRFRRGPAAMWFRRLAGTEGRYRTLATAVQPSLAAALLEGRPTPFGSAVGALGAAVLGAEAGRLAGRGRQVAVLMLAAGSAAVLTLLHPTWWPLVEIGLAVGLGAALMVDRGFTARAGWLAVGAMAFATHGPGLAVVVTGFGVAAAVVAHGTRRGDPPTQTSPWALTVGGILAASVGLRGLWSLFVSWGEHG